MMINSNIFFDSYLDDIENGTVLKYELVNANKYKLYKNIMVSVSGGSDSDILVDMFARIDIDKRVKYVFFDTGLEYKATKEHLTYLENRYDIVIEKVKAIKPIPTCCKEFGQPFISKQVSQNIETLQRHNFKFEDLPLNTLIEQYPNCKSAIVWWTGDTNIKHKKYLIIENKWLKEFILSNPPTFKISDKCCKYAKKELSKNYEKLHKIDLKITGVRKSEGGLRASSYQNCFTRNFDKNYDDYRPVFFFTNDDKRYYNKFFTVKNSDCYSKWGFKRTGCTGCPFNKNLKNDLQIIEKYEPDMYKACNNVFKDSYAYTKAYHVFRQAQERKKYRYKYKKLI